jgi:hypothetical protein
MSKRGAQVVITRKDKRLHKGAHLLAFALTGGISGIVTAGKAATNVGYNARTAQLVAQSQQPDTAVTDADHARAVAAGQAFMARTAGATNPRDARRMRRLQRDVARYGAGVLTPAQQAFMASQQPES